MKILWDLALVIQVSNDIIKASLNQLNGANIALILTAHKSHALLGI